MRRYFSGTEVAPAQPLSGAGYVYRQLRQLGLSDMAARAVQPHVRARSYEIGSPIWRRGSSIEGWMLVMSGMVGKSIPAGKNCAVPLEVYGAGSWFGEQAMLSGLPSMADYTCLVDTDSLVLPRQVVDNLLRAEPAFGEHLARLVCHRLVTSSEALALHKTGTSCAKVVIGLAQLAVALNADYEEARRRDKTLIPIPQGALAAICGVSRTVFSNFVLQLEKKGWIALSYGGAEFLQMGQWLALLQAQRADPHTNSMGTVEQILAVAARKELVPG